MFSFICLYYRLFHYFVSNDLQTLLFSNYDITVPVFDIIFSLFCCQVSETFHDFVLLLVRCDYKSCYYRSWGRWSATCGSVTRTRRYYYSRDRYTHVKEASQCDKYPKTCESYQQQNKTLSVCPSTLLLYLHSIVKALSFDSLTKFCHKHRYFYQWISF